MTLIRTNRSGKFKKNAKFLGRTELVTSFYKLRHDWSK